jgi:hypothetical protein
MTPRARVQLLVTTLAMAALVVTVLVSWRIWPADQAKAWDLPVYERYGERMAAGDVPYRDFSLEYPPGALPAFVLPALDAFSGTPSGPRIWEPEDAVDDGARSYAHAFAGLIVLLGWIALVATSVSLARLGRPLSRWVAAHGTIVLSPLVLGALVTTRYDLLPAALVAVAVAAVLARRHTGGGVALGLAAAAKLFPLALAPLFVAYAWRCEGRPAARRLVAGLLAALVVVFVPFVVVAPSGLADALREQAGRGLQAESTPAVALVAVSRGLWKAGVLDDLPLRLDEGEPGGLVTAEIEGGGARAMAALSTLAVACVVVWAWLAAARRPVSSDELVRLTAIVVAAILALGQVLSPQFLIWLLPLAPLVAGRRGLAATALLVVSLATTQAWFPDVYRRYVDTLDAPSTAVLLARNGLLVALLLVLAWPAPRRARGTA